MDNKVTTKTLEQKIFKAAIIFIIACSSLTVILLVIVFIRDYGKTDIPTTQVVKQQQQAINIFAKDLYEEYSKNAVKADSLYKDKILQVSGRVYSVANNIIGSGSYVLLKTESDIISIQCEFIDSEQISKLADLKIDDWITIKGICKGSLFNIGLSECELK